MKKAIRVSIPKPCTEQWSSFEPTAQGGFCGGCRQEVIDFTVWSDERIKAYFSTRPQNTCGRFRPAQLKVYETPPEARVYRGWMSVLLMSVVMLFTSRQSMAQQRPKPDTVQLQSPKKIGESQPTTRKNLRFSGVVKSAEDSTAQPGVNVVRKGTNEGTVTDGDGKFVLDIDMPLPTETIVFSFIGLKSVEYSLRSDEPPGEVIIKMEYDVMVLGGYVVGGVQSLRWYNPRRWWWGVRDLFRR